MWKILKEMEKTSGNGENVKNTFYIAGKFCTKAFLRNSTGFFIKLSQIFALVGKLCHCIKITQKINSKMEPLPSSSSFPFSIQMQFSSSSSFPFYISKCSPYPPLPPGSLNLAFCHITIVFFNLSLFIFV